MTDTPSEGILKPGDVLNNTYVIAELVASGGTGEVYRATNRVSGREIAIKILKAEFAQNEQFTDLMKREASVLHEVIDPSVVRYYDLLEADMHGGFLFIVMEFIHGMSLADNMRRTGPLPDDVLLQVAQRILLGLKAAHDKNAFHRDLSPDNVILRDDDPMQATLIDFGIAKDVNEGAKTVVGDGFAGKYQYAAPEQMEGNADGRSDLYSLGMTLIGAYRGQSPSAGSSLMQIIKAKADKPDISDMAGPLHALVSRLVEPDANDRFASADEALAFMATGGAPAASVDFETEKTVVFPRTPTAQPVSVPPVSVHPTSVHPTSVPAASIPPVTTPLGSEQTIDKIRQDMQEPKKGKSGMWIGLAALLLVGGGAGGYFAGLFGPTPPSQSPPIQIAVDNTQPPEPPVPIVIDQAPQIDPTVIPDTPTVAIPTLNNNADPTVPSIDSNPDIGLSTSQPIAVPSADAVPSPVPAPQLDPTAPPASSPGQLTAPVSPTAIPNQSLTPNTSPGQQSTPNQVTALLQTPDTAPTAAPTVLPVASPYTLSIQRLTLDSPLILRGNLPSADALPPITAILEEQLGAFAVMAEIKPASGMPVAGWDNRIVAIALNFARLDAWSISASDKTVTLRAKARNAAERTALLNSARRALQGSGMVIDDQITVLLSPVKMTDVNAGLQKIASCGPLHLGGGNNGIIGPGDALTVFGNLATAAEIPKVQAYLNDAAPGRSVINDLSVINDGVCAVLQILPAVPSSKLRVDYTLGGSENPVLGDSYHLGENPVIDIAIDARAKGYMSVIFIDQSDQVFHLLPHQARKQNQLQTIGTVKGGIRRIRVAFPIAEASVAQLGFKVVEPLGANMIVAVVTPKPLFNELRPRAESNAAFVDAVQNKLQFGDESAGIVTFRSLITEP